MNEQKIEQVQNKINHLLEKARTADRGTFALARDMNQVMRDDLEEYNALLSLTEILKDTERENGNPYIFVDGATIKESRKLDYYNMLERTSLSTNNNVDEVVAEEQNQIDENPKIEEPEQQEQITENIDSNAKLDSDNPYELLGIDENASLEEARNARRNLLKQYNSEDEIQKLNAAYNMIKDSKNPTLTLPPGQEVVGLLNPSSEEVVSEETNKLIPGTNIPMPRKRLDNESIEEYEAYLKEHYKPFGIGNDEIEYYSGTEIPKMRGKYPHETLDDVAKTDPYYDEMLNYYAEKYTKKPDDTNNTPGEDLGNEVVGVRDGKNFLKKYKKPLLIAAGLTTLALASPTIIPAIMYANSTLWTTSLAKAIPAIQSFLHGCNSFLGGLINASYNAATGVWTSAAGDLINAAAANASVVSALAVSALNIGVIGTTAKKLMDKWKNRKKSKDKKVETEETNVNNVDNKKEQLESSEQEVHSDENTTETELSKDDKMAMWEKLNEENFISNESNENNENNMWEKLQEINEKNFEDKKNDMKETNDDIFDELQNVTERNFLSNRNNNTENSIVEKSTESTNEVQPTTIDESNEKLSLKDIEDKITHYTNVMSKMPLQHQVEVQLIINELNRIYEIISKGKSSPITETLDFDGYRIVPEDLKEFKNLLDKHNIKYKIDDNKVMEAFYRLNENASILDSNDLDVTKGGMKR